MTLRPDPKPGKKRKKKRETDEAYLDFIRSQPCVVMGTTPSIPHHEDIEKSGGTAYKCSDRFTIPLSYERHTERHNVGRYTFSLKYSIDYVSEIKRLQNMFDNL